MSGAGGGRNFLLVNPDNHSDVVRGLASPVGIQILLAAVGSDRTVVERVEHAVGVELGQHDARKPRGERRQDAYDRADQQKLMRHPLLQAANAARRKVGSALALQRAQAPQRDQALVQSRTRRTLGGRAM